MTKYGISIDELITSVVFDHRFKIYSHDRHFHADQLDKREILDSPGVNGKAEQQNLGKKQNEINCVKFLECCDCNFLSIKF